MSDKTEYSRLLLKRTGISGEVPTIPPITATTLNEFDATDLFVGEMYVNTADDLLFIRTDSGILPISLSGSTGTTIPDLLTVLSQDNITGAFPIVVSSGSTIQYLGIPSGSTSTILALDASGNTITTAIAGATQSLDSVLSYGNITGIFDIVVSSGQTIQYLGLNSGTTTTILGLDASGNTITTTCGGSQNLSQVLTQGNETNGSDIIVSTGDTISSPNGENEIFLQSTGYMGLQSTYTLAGNNIVDEIKMRAPSPSDAGIEITSTDNTNSFSTKREYRPTSITDYSFDSGGSFVSTDLDYSGFTIDLSNTSAGYLTIDGLLPGTATDLLGIDANNRVVPYTISASTDYYVTGGTFSTSGGTLTLERQNGSVSITGFTSNVGCVGITIDGAGSAITTGIAGSIIVPYACVIDCWAVIADQSGSIVVDVWKGSSPLTIPTSASDSIAGSEKPTLSSQQINTDLNLTTWTTNLVFGDVLVFNVDSATTVERITLQIKVIKL